MNVLYFLPNMPHNINNIKSKNHLTLRDKNRIFLKIIDLREVGLKTKMMEDKIMKRKEFLNVATLSLGAIFGLPLWSRAITDPLVKINIRDYFKWEDEEVISLTEKVIEKCVFNKVMPPEGVFNHRWIKPGGIYNGQWIWDTMFVTDLLSIFPGKLSAIHDVFHNYRDFQYRWNSVKAPYAHNMIACMISPDRKNWMDFPAYSQIPILAWGIEQVYKRTKDIELVYNNLKSLEDFHEWYWRERDVTNVGMVSVGAYSGDEQHARFETFDFDGTLDDLHLTKHPTKHNITKGTWYGDVLVVGNTSYLVMAEQSLTRLARIVGDEAMAKRREKRIEKSVKAMRKYMWDEESGMFFALKRDSLDKIKETSVGCWMPLLAKIPTKAMAKRIAENLESEAYQTPLPIPTMSQNDPRYKSNGFWRGDVWTVTNYQIAKGIKSYGYDELAAKIADATIANSIKNGVSEHHDSQTGKALGVDFLGMSCTVVTMMLEGISKKYKLSIKSL
jgi:hypothetical protein